MLNAQIRDNSSSDNIFTAITNIHSPKNVKTNKPTIDNN